MHRTAFLPLFFFGGLLGACLLLPPEISAQAAHQERGIPIVEYFDTKAAGFDVANFCSVRDSRGLLRVANPFGLLEYDGISWRVLPTPIHSPVFSVACGNDGTVYAGMLGAFGRVVTRAAGDVRMELLSDRLPKGSPPLGRIDFLSAIGDTVWFGSSGALCRYDGTTCTLLEAQTSFRRIFNVNDRIYVQQQGIGLCVVDGDSVVSLPGGETFADERNGIAFICGGKDGALLIGTKHEGVYLYDGSRAQLHWDYRSHPGPAYIPLCGIRLSDGTLALGTLRSGVRIVDEDGTLITVLNEDVGLGDDAVIHLSEDDDGNIWVSLDDGLARIEWPSRVTVFHSSSGLDGQISSIIRFHGTLYTGTTQGLFRLQDIAAGESDPALSRSCFTPLPAINATVYDLLSAGDGLLVCTSEAIYTMDAAERLRRITKRGSRLLHAVHGNRDTIVVGRETGIDVLTRSPEGWAVRTLIEQSDAFILSLCETADGTIWAGSAQSGVYRLELSPGVHSRDIRTYGTADGLPTGPILVHALRGRLVMITEDRTYTYDALRDRFIVDSVFGALDPTSLEDPRFIHEDSRGRIWIQQFDGTVGMASLDRDGNLVFESTPFSRLRNEGILSMHSDDDGVCWFGSEGKLVRYDPSVPQRFRKPFQTLIRSLHVDGKTRYGGNTLPPVDTPLRISCKHRRLVVALAAPYFGMRQAMQYTYRLEGRDTLWQMSGRNGEVEFFLLPPGRYLLRARAMNAEGVYGREAVIAFTVLPPWERWWTAPVVLGMKLYLGVMGAYDISPWNILLIALVFLVVCIIVITFGPVFRKTSLPMIPDVPAEQKKSPPDG
ncbi:MAG: hypothetical protein JXA28_13930 [Bacteroidetes bacterium]|nr:hypothetical protein [Bacteroidota bacterium]